MDKSIKNRQDVTARRVGGRKILILCASGAALAVDIAVIIMLAAAGITASGYLACPIIMLIVDVAFLLFAVFSNFRFKYSLVGAIVFAVIEAILTLIMFASHAGGERAMTSASLGLWTAAHCAVIAAVIVLAIDGASMGRIMNRAATVVAAILGILLIGYTAFAISFGVFGQGSGARTLTFTADGDDGYVVSGIVKGRGNAIIIPKSFDGKPVTAVDCSVFCADGIEEIYLDIDETPELKNVNALVDFRDIPVRVHRDNVNSVRNDYFSNARSSGSEGLAKFASAIEPTGLNKNEVFITYDYDVKALRDVNGKVLPVWIGGKDDMFKVSDFATLDPSLDYAAHSDYDSPDDLHWCYTNERGMLDVANAGLTLNNTPIVSSITKATPEFLRVYAVKIGEDNDTKYELPDTYTKTALKDGVTVLDYRLTTIKTANRITLIERDGFNLSWQRYKSNIRVNFDSLAEELQESQSDMTIFPMWGVKAPTISRVDAEWTGNNAAIYGDPLTLTPVIDKGVTGGFEFSYAWTKPTSDGVMSSDNGSLHIDAVKMDCAGDYKLTVTKSSPSSSLTATAEHSSAVRVNKRTMPFTWTEFADAHYDGTPKEMKCAYDATQLVAGDVITFGRNIAAVTNAGTYTASVTLTGDCAYKYVVDDSSRHTYTVLPRELKLDWLETAEFVYDGDSHTPTYTFRPGFEPISDDDVSAYTLGAGKNVGTYTASVNIRNGNYVIAEGATKLFTVKKREIGAVTFGSPAGGFTYNGGAQMPTVATVANYADGEADLLKKLVSDNLQKSGDCVHAGNYVLTVTLPENCNYAVPTVKPTISFTIEKKPTRVTVNNINAIYGQAYSYSYTASDMISGDSLAIMYFVNNIEAHSNEKRDVGEYTITAVASNSDYMIEDIETGTLKITERTLDIYAFDATKTYDGKPYKGFQGSVGGLGFASGDSYNEVIASFTYLCDGVNASETPYVITPSYTLTEGKGKNYTLNYHTGELTITKANLTVKINDRTHVYDGTVPSGGTVSAVSGLAEGETVATAGLGIYYVTPNVPSVGTYTVTGIGTSNNYNVTVQQGTLTITPRPITIEWNDETFTYDGNSHLPTIKNINNVIDGKEPKITVTGAQINAGKDYTATATLDRNNNQYSGNYVIIAGATKTFDIERATATFTWSGKTEYALGETVSIGAVCSISGLGYALVYYDASGVAFMGAPTAVGSYTVRAVITNNNYAPVNDEFTFEIKEATDGGQSV